MIPTDTAHTTDVSLRLSVVTPTATPSPQPRIQIWWPDELYPVDSSEAETILFNQFEDFRQTYRMLDLDVRRKRSAGLGGILTTLRSAVPVAPNALPDLTLMRRSDMLTAATEGLIAPLESWAPPDVLDGLLPGARRLGEINGILYGIPYGLTIHHVIYRQSVFEEPLLTFSDVLANEPAYLFPAGPAQGSQVSWTVLLQYRATGGHLVDENGNPMLERDPLLTVFQYYEQGVDQGIFDAGLLNYTQFTSYWTSFVAADVNMISIDTLTYLSQSDTIQNVGFAPIPTADGVPTTSLDGWMWVLTTQDPDRQSQARTFLSWMMRVNQQSLFTEAFGILPSQERAFRLWDNAAYATFAESLIADGQIISHAERSNSAAIALQEGLAAVLSGTTAEDAADIALSRFTQ
jgi:ABC-type glycerol-3-phosphate transport system substrate-binding protein